MVYAARAEKQQKQIIYWKSLMMREMRMLNVTTRSKAVTEADRRWADPLEEI